MVKHESSERVLRKKLFAETMEELTKHLPSPLEIRNRYWEDPPTLEMFNSESKLGWNVATITDVEKILAKRTTTIDYGSSSPLPLLENFAENLEMNGFDVTLREVDKHYAEQKHYDVSNGGCWIATAAYGSPLAEELNSFRAFRDGFLNVTAIGRRLVRFYYRTSPPIADYVAKHLKVKTVVKLILEQVRKLLENPCKPDSHG